MLSTENCGGESAKVTSVCHTSAIAPCSLRSTTISGCSSSHFGMYGCTSSSPSRRPNVAVLVRRQVLVGQEDHPMLDQQLPKLREAVVVESAEVEPADLGAQRAGHPADGHGRDGGAATCVAAVMPIRLMSCD